MIKGLCPCDLVSSLFQSMIVRIKLFNKLFFHVAFHRLFLLVKLFFSYIIFVAFMLQFYVPMDFLEPIVYHKLLKVDHLTYRFPRCHGFIQGLIQNGFRVVIVLLIGTN